MSPEPTLEARDLLYLARVDLASSERLLAGDPLVETALFHCQQAVEKALKAYLSFHQRDYPFTHDLDELVELCGAVDAEFGTIQLASARLTRFAVVFRYKRDPAITSREVGLQRFEVAKRLVRFVEERLPPEVTQEGSPGG